MVLLLQQWNAPGGDCTPLDAETRCSADCSGHIRLMHIQLAAMLPNATPGASEGG